MGRYRLNYSLYPRSVNGKTVFYYRSYGPDGTRTTGKSTFCTSKTKARLYCEELLKKGELVHGTGTKFGVYAEGFYDLHGRYMKRISIGRTVSSTSLRIRNSHMTTHILPFFSDMKFSQINKASIEKFQDLLIKKGLQSGSIKSVMVTLKLVLDEAYKDALLPSEPFLNVRQVAVKNKTRDGFTLDEIKMINCIEWGNRETKMAFQIAVLTGMRISEILAIRNETVFEDYILVKDQRIVNESEAKIKLRKDKMQETKTHTVRKVPICKEVHDWLVSNTNPKKVFTITCVGSVIEYQFSKMIKLGLLKNAKERKLSFHSIRHFFNTYMISNNPGREFKVACVMGHKVGASKVQGCYTNFKLEDLMELTESQRKLFFELGLGF